ncbi:MAG: DUF4440 domain-containing protein [Acidobacteria bacterium]|nr:DUF4440 domain-containing protein [Acidobacteriota bacterium]
MKKFYLIFCLTILFMSINTFSQTKNEKAETRIRKVMSDQMDAWNRGDIEAFMEGYWNSPELKFVSGDRVTKGWQPTLDNYKKSYDSKAKMGVLKFTILDVNIVSNDAAIVLGSWALDRVVDGKKDDPHGKFTLIFRKFKDGWKIVHDHTS